MVEYSALSSYIIILDFQIYYKLAQWLKTCSIFLLYLQQCLHGCYSINNQLIISYPKGLIQVASFCGIMWALQSGVTEFDLIASAY